MSKIPADCRSFHRVTLKAVVSRLVSASFPAALKSGTARRIFSTPKPVPVRIQSCDERVALKAQTRIARRMVIADRFIPYPRIDQLSLLLRHCGPASSLCNISPAIVEPELHCDVVAVVSSRQRPKSIDALQSTNRRLIERWDTARLLDTNIGRLPGTIDLKVNVDASRVIDARIDLVLHPVVRYFAAHNIDVIRETATEIALTALKSKAAFGSPRSERTVRAADRSPLPVRN